MPCLSVHLGLLALGGSNGGQLEELVLGGNDEGVLEQVEVVVLEAEEEVVLRAKVVVVVLGAEEETVLGVEVVGQVERVQEEAVFGWGQVASLHSSGQHSRIFR